MTLRVDTISARRSTNVPTVGVDLNGPPEIFEATSLPSPANTKGEALIDNGVSALSLDFAGNPLTQLDHSPSRRNAATNVSWNCVHSRTASLTVCLSQKAQDCAVETSACQTRTSCT